jgi:pimeloyl-ACP methyl ester carboxylesterase
MKAEFRFPSLADARARMPFADRWTDEMRDHYSRYSFRAVDGPDTGVAPDEGEVEWRYFIPGVIETEAALEHDMWDRIAVRCPLLAIRGADSHVFDETRMARLASIVPGCRTMAIDANHRVSQDNPAALAAAVDAFIRDAA